MTSPMHSPLQSPLQPVMRSPLEFRRRGGFNPASLFRNGEVGAYYDPSDLTTLYQDSVGTIPGAVGQPVGLMLDKSQGLELGPEIVPPTAFTSTAGWVGTDCTVALVGSEIEITATTTGFVFADLSIGTESSSDYKLVATYRSGTGNPNTQVGIAHPGRNAYTTGTVSPTPVTGQVINLVGRVALRLLIYANAIGHKGYVSAASVKLLAGNHASQPTAGNRPLLKSTSGKWWLDFDVIDDELIATFPSSLGSACTIGKALNPASTIVGAQTIGTTYTMNADNFSTVITNDALTADETAKLQTWLDKKAGNV